jgi:hypothetical protein
MATSSHRAVFQHRYSLLSFGNNPTRWINKHRVHANEKTDVQMLDRNELLEYKISKSFLGSEEDICQITVLSLRHGRLRNLEVIARLKTYRMR